MKENQEPKKEEAPIEIQQKVRLENMEKARRSWAAYKSIEEDLLRIIEYLPLETRQYGFFSFKLADIIIRSCTQIESLFKEFVREKILLDNLKQEEYDLLRLKVEEGRTNILDFIKAFQKNLDLKKELFSLRANGDSFAPFNIYLKKENKDIPFWWTIYNKLKHDFSKNLEMANLQAAVCSLGALFILNCKVPRNQEHLILNGIISSLNFIHIGHFLGYMAQEEKTRIYNVLAQTPIFEFWIFYNQETIGLTVTGSMQVGGI